MTGKKAVWHPFFRRVKRITQGQPLRLATVPASEDNRADPSGSYDNRLEDREVIVILWCWPRGAQSTHVAQIVVAINSSSKNSNSHDYCSLLQFFLFYQITFCVRSKYVSNKSKCNEFKNGDNIFKTKVHNCECITAKNVASTTRIFHVTIILQWL